MDRAEIVAISLVWKSSVSRPKISPKRCPFKNVSMTGVKVRYFPTADVPVKLDRISVPSSTLAHFGLGVVLAVQNKMSEALAEFHKEEEIAPEDSRSYVAAAAFANMRGRKDDAAEEWRRLLKVDPGNQNAALALSEILYQRGKYTEAASVLEVLRPPARSRSAACR